MDRQDSHQQQGLESLRQCRLAMECLRLGDSAGAQALLERALELQPDCCHALFELLLLLERQGQNQAASRCYQACLERLPGLPEKLGLVCGLGEMLLKNGRTDPAAGYARKALAIDPGCARAKQLLAESLQAKGLISESNFYFVQARALSLDPRLNPRDLQFEAERPGLEEGLYRRFLTFDPDNPLARQALGETLLKQGRLQEAEALFAAILTRDPDNLAAEIGTASVREKQGRYLDALTCLARALGSPALPAEELISLLFSQGSCYEKLGRPAQAFDCYIRANALRPVRREPDLSGRALATFDRELVKALRAKGVVGNLSRRPVFIVGMPRSGTSLVEQILASHPDVLGAGEVPTLWEVFQQLLGYARPAASWREQLLSLPPAAYAQAAAGYLAALEGGNRPCERITDKMPFNYCLLGLIQVLFPQARVVHCRRHPLATCLSCFSTHFQYLGFTASLERLGRHYRQYQDLMAHWERELDLASHALDYEALVADQSGQTRRLLEACGLDWDERCLDFYKTERHVSTASHDQVKQPIYATSVARYKLFESQLAPLMQWIDLSRWPQV
ncbi:MAG: sulfotransferase [Candidatus Sericytochromatia bacterium]